MVEVVLSLVLFRDVESRRPVRELMEERSDFEM